MQQSYLNAKMEEAGLLMHDMKQDIRGIMET